VIIVFFHRRGTEALSSLIVLYLAPRCLYEAKDAPLHFAVCKFEVEVKVKIKIEIKIIRRILNETNFKVQMSNQIQNPKVHVQVKVEVKVKVKVQLQVEVEIKKSKFQIKSQGQSSRSYVFCYLNFDIYPVG